MIVQQGRASAMNWVVGLLQRRRTAQFVARSRSRDLDLDRRRFDTISRSIEQVETEIRREHDGLARRLHSARLQVSGLVGSEPFEYLDRDSVSERVLSQAEVQMDQASRRLVRLDAVLADLTQLKGKVAEIRAGS